jgi:DNA/RNA-binding domain of Phe-tRNA-synthetase-like protein
MAVANGAGTAENGSTSDTSDIGLAIEGARVARLGHGVEPGTLPRVTGLAVPDHPLLQLEAFVAELPDALEHCPSPDWLRAGLRLDAETPLSPPDESVRKAVRELLRHGGFKPSGRSKPASEFLLRAATEGALSSINLAVDLCNVTSLHSGLPISVVDLDLLAPPLRVAIAEAGSSYVFNPAGQEMRLDGLVCLFDGMGASANPVKDSQRTKTHAGTRRTLCVVWGCQGLSIRAREAVAWYRSLHERAGVRVREYEA